VAKVIKDVPNDGANFGGAGDAVEAFDANKRYLRGHDKIQKGIRDAQHGTAIDQNVKRVRMEDGQ
jgi:hypothetical protein